jgi:oligo-1,6-glucosidase
VNHTSDEHPWFVASSGTAQPNPYSDYYIWRDEGRTNNWGASFGGPAWAYAPGRGAYYFHAFSEKQPDLNWENPKVREEVYDMMRWWCDKGIDGFRMDVINMISKPRDMADGVPGPDGLSPVGAHVCNGPRVHEYLQEMRREVLDRYDLITVGEAPGASIEDAKRYAGFGSGELNMVFQFEHMGLESGVAGKWADRPPPLSALKRTLSAWQTGLDGAAWNSLYWDNHDQPRVVSRFGDDGRYRVESAKMLATCLHFMQGTPYIYQGEELGMTNAGYTRIDQYKDIEARNAYRDLVGLGVVSERRMLSCLAYMARDNARTPMQWDGGANAGFSAGTPWMPVNPNHAQINAAAQAGDPNSVLAYYKKLIRLRKRHDVVVYGGYRPLCPASGELFCYERALGEARLLVCCNFTGASQPFEPPEAYAGGERLIGNYARAGAFRGGRLTLAPYEAFAVLAP